MSPLVLLLRSLIHHRRIHAAVAMGVFAATAVLTGALLVGDSMRGSLQHLTKDRLGQIDEVLVSPRLFRTELSTELATSPDFANHFSAAVPALFVQATVEKPAETPDAPTARAGKVNLLGCLNEFWKLGTGGPAKHPQRDEIVLNEPLAAALGITREMLAKSINKPLEVLLRIGQVSQIPADSPLGRKTETTRSRRVKVIDIIPATGLGRFSIRPNQQVPRNAYCSIDTLQAMLEQKEKVNTILVAGKMDHGDPAASDHDALVKMFTPQLADYGVAIRMNKRGYFNVTSDRMLLEPAIETAAMRAYLSDFAQPALTYLANYILVGKDDKGKIPYSTITAMDFTTAAPLGPFVTPEGETIGPLKEDEIVLNHWAFDDLKTQGVEVNIGDPIKLVYFEPESTHGDVLEQTATFKLKAIVDLTGPANDPDFTPELKGVTDEASIANWNPPFPYFPERVRTIAPNDQDDRYWKKYKATPKAFLSLAAGQKLWASRFGRATSVRVPLREKLTEDRLKEKLKLDPVALGLEFMPVKRWGLLAASGTTPFGLLFLGFSFFIIAAAVMLIALLFRLGVEQRAKEIGLLAAVGWSVKKIRRLLLVEGLVVAIVGAAVGTLAGIGYAWLMLTGLKTWWLGAITTPFLDLYITPQSLLIGLATGVVVAIITIAWTLRGLKKTSVRGLLGGQFGLANRVTRRADIKNHLFALGLFVVAIALGMFAGRLSGEAQAGAFFGAGALVLAAALIEISALLRGGEGKSLVATGIFPLAWLAVRNAARNPGRSTLTIGLVASATFLIVAISAFRLDPPKRDGGYAGIDFVVETDQPIHFDLNTEEGREKLGFTPDESEQVKRAKIFSMRVQSGDDASCLNLYQPRQPRILGLPKDFDSSYPIDAETVKTKETYATVWSLVHSPLTTANSEEIVPVILDENTALYSLHIGDFMHSPLGMTYTITDGRGAPLKLQVIGLLKNSIFQGDLLMSEANLLKHFPDVSGYRMLLVEMANNGDVGLTPNREMVRATFSDALSDFGVSIERTEDRLAGFMVVQNTYLSTFQSLGGLGLLLGTLGLATVQLRNVFERRGELALLRAVGFRRRRLAGMVLLENAALLLAGLLAGLFAALVAVWPHLFGAGASLPWHSLEGTLAVVPVVGLLAGFLAVRAMLRAPLLPALREE